MAMGMLPLAVLVKSVILPSVPPWTACNTTVYVEQLGRHVYYHMPAVHIMPLL